jgi:hypothetical protein
MSFSTIWFFRILGVLAFCLCGQSIAYSSNPIFFSVFALATAGVFILFHGSALPVFILLAAGPVINMSALYRDPYVYNIEIVILTYVGSFVWKRAHECTFKNADSISASYIAMLLTILISALVHVIFYANNLYAEIRLIRVFLIGGFLLAFLVSIEEKHISVYYKTALLTTLLVSTAGLVEFFVHGIFAHNWGLEPRSVFSGSESLAVFLCTIVPFVLIGKPTQKNSVWQYIAGFTVVASIVLLMSTRSRTGILSLFVFLLFYGIHILRTQPRKKTGIFIAIVCVVVTSITTAGLKTYSTGYQIFDKPFSLLFSSRTQAWSEGIKSFSMAPLWGCGPGSNAYNLYIQILSQYGVFGFTGFLIFTIFVFVKYYRGSRAVPQSLLNQGILWSVITFLIAGVGESAIGNQFGYYILFLLLLLGKKNISNTNRNEIPQTCSDPD